MQLCFEISLILIIFNFDLHITATTSINCENKEPSGTFPPASLMYGKKDET